MFYRTTPLALHLVAAMLIGMPVSISAGIVSGDWLELIDTTRLPVLREDQCFLASSYDRLGGNNDGFFGTFSFLRIEDGAFVLFDEDGPGCIYRIWSANPGLNRIEFYFDGEATPRLVFDNWLDMFRNRVEPFVEPVSTFALGGCVSYVPIPYATSLKIIARDRPKFYQFTYQKFADSDDIKTFQPAMDAETYARYSRVLAAWNNPGAPPWPEVIEAEQTSVETIPPGASEDVVSILGTGAVYSLDLDGIAKSQFRHILLRIQVDGEAAQVDCPLDAFFVQVSLFVPLRQMRWIALSTPSSCRVEDDRHREACWQAAARTARCTRTGPCHSELPSQSPS